jgi:hypothetical protein
MLLSQLAFAGGVGTLEDFSFKNSLDCISMDYFGGKLDGTTINWASDGHATPGSLEIAAHLLSSGNDYLTYLLKGHWKLTPLDRIEFWMKGDGQRSNIYLIVCDAQNRVASVGPGYGHGEFVTTTAEWQRFQIDVGKDIA